MSVPIMMIPKEEFSQEFVNLVTNYYPGSAYLIEQCYVKLLECYIERLGKRLYYIGIYYPEEITQPVFSYQNAFKEIAENMGLAEVVLINANRLVRDPMSTLKNTNPRLWLELYWIALKNTH